jgi:hypothetical protein
MNSRMRILLDLLIERIWELEGRPKTFTRTERINVVPKAIEEGQVHDLAIEQAIAELNKSSTEDGQGALPFTPCECGLDVPNLRYDNYILHKSVDFGTKCPWDPIFEPSEGEGYPPKKEPEHIGRFF